MNVYFDCGRIIKIRTVQGLRAAGFSLLLLLHSLLLLQHTLFCKQQVIRCCFVYRCVESPYVLQFSSEITPVTTEAVGLDKLGELVLSEWSCWAHTFSSVCAQLTKSFQSLGPSEGWWGRGGGRNSVLPSTGHLELALSGNSLWCCLWKDGLDHELPPLQLPVVLQFCTRISCLGIRVSIK